MRKFICISGSLLLSQSLLLGLCSSVLAQTTVSQPRSGAGYAMDSPSSVRLWQEGDPGQRLHLRGRVTSSLGMPIAGAGVTVWQADGAGDYHEQRYRAHLFTRDNGEFRLTTAVPGQYFGLKHIHIMISHPDYQPLNTQILFRGDPALAPEDEDLAILLEVVREEDGGVMVGSVEFMLEPL